MQSYLAAWLSEEKNGVPTKYVGCKNHIVVYVILSHEKS